MRKKRFGAAVMQHQGRDMQKMCNTGKNQWKWPKKGERAKERTRSRCGSLLSFGSARQSFSFSNKFFHARPDAILSIKFLFFFSKLFFCLFWLSGSALHVFLRFFSSCWDADMPRCRDVGNKNARPDIISTLCIVQHVSRHSLHFQRPYIQVFIHSFMIAGTTKCVLKYLKQRVREFCSPNNNTSWKEHTYKKIYETFISWIIIWNLLVG